MSTQGPMCMSSDAPVFYLLSSKMHPNSDSDQVPGTTGTKRINICWLDEKKGCYKLKNEWGCSGPYPTASQPLYPVRHNDFQLPHSPHHSQWRTCVETGVNDSRVKAAVLLGGLWTLELLVYCMESASKAFLACWHRKHISVSTPSIFIARLTSKRGAVKLINYTEPFFHPYTPTQTPSVIIHVHIIYKGLEQ